MFSPKASVHACVVFILSLSIALLFPSPIPLIMFVQFPLFLVNCFFSFPFVTVWFIPPYWSCCFFPSSSH